MAAKYTDNKYCPKCGYETFYGFCTRWNCNNGC